MHESIQSEFKITPFESKNLTWWNARRSKIDMNPEYQRRGRLWSETDKAYLIDSIINGFDVPKLYVADFTWRESKLNREKLPYAIIDGKQRLEAIFDFFDSRISMNEDFVFRADPSLKLSGLSYKDLQKNFPEIAEEFENYNLSVMGVFARDVLPINELFVRLNRSKALTGAEIRNAMGGPAPAVIREISKHNVFTENIRFEIKRGQDKNAAAKILMFEFYGKPTDTKKNNLDKFVTDQKRLKNDLLELIGRKVLDVLDDMSEIFLPADRLLSSAGVFPVYYMLVRDTAKARHYRVRQFLLEFEQKRKSNKDKIIKDDILLKYDDYNRSTNDVGSHVERLRILQDNFTKWDAAKTSVSVR